MSHSPSSATADSSAELSPSPPHGTDQVVVTGIDEGTRMPDFPQTAARVANASLSVPKAASAPTPLSESAINGIGAGSMPNPATPGGRSPDKELATAENANPPAVEWLRFAAKVMADPALLGAVMPAVTEQATQYVRGLVAEHCRRTDVDITIPPDLLTSVLTALVEFLRAREVKIHSVSDLQQIGHTIHETCFKGATTRLLPLLLVRDVPSFYSLLLDGDVGRAILSPACLLDGSFFKVLWRAWETVPPQDWTLLNRAFQHRTRLLRAEGNDALTFVGKLFSAMAALNAHIGQQVQSSLTASVPTRSDDAPTNDISNLCICPPAMEGGSDAARSLWTVAHEWAPRPSPTRPPSDAAMLPADAAMLPPDPRARAVLRILREVVEGDAFKACVKQYWGLNCYRTKVEVHQVGSAARGTDIRKYSDQDFAVVFTSIDEEGLSISFDSLDWGACIEVYKCLSSEFFRLYAAAAPCPTAVAAEAETKVKNRCINIRTADGMANFDVSLRLWRRTHALAPTFVLLVLTNGEGHGYSDETVKWERSYAQVYEDWIKLVLHCAKQHDDELPDCPAPWLPLIIAVCRLLKVYNHIAAYCIGPRDGDAGAEVPPITALPSLTLDGLAVTEVFTALAENKLTSADRNRQLEEALGRVLDRLREEARYIQLPHPIYLPGTAMKEMVYKDGERPISLQEMSAGGHPADTLASLASNLVKPPFVVVQGSAPESGITVAPIRLWLLQQMLSKTKKEIIEEIRNIKPTDTPWSIGGISYLATKVFSTL